MIRNLFAKKKRIKQKYNKNWKCLIKMILSKQIFSNKVFKVNQIILANSQNNINPSPRSRKKEFKKTLEMWGKRMKDNKKSNKMIKLQNIKIKFKNK